MTSPRWQVLRGDCAALLAEMPERFADHVITDPPYDEKTHKYSVNKSTHQMAKRGKSYHSLTTVDFASGDPSVITPMLLRACKRWCIAFCSAEQLGAYAAAAGQKRWIRAGCWDKIRVAPQLSGDRPAQAWEAIAIMHAARTARPRWNGHGGYGMWRHMSETKGARPDHPTPKPVALMLELIEQFTEPGELILDPYCGSGSTGVAALRLGRRFLGIECDERYHALSVARLEAEERCSDARSMADGQRPLF